MRRLLPMLVVFAGLGSLAFGAAAASAAAPTIPFTGVSEVTTTSATLEADVNPQEKASEYRFEYGPADCASNPCTSTPVPDGKLKKGGTPVRVTAHLEGLQPGTTYHFRVVAHNTEGEIKSPDRLFAPYSLPQAFEACPNDTLRKGAGERLPDCRAYEQASPVGKNGGDVTSTVPFIGTSPNGDAVTFMSDAGIPGGEGSQELPLYLATRGKGGWSTQGLLPAASTGQNARVLGWLPDYSQTYSIATKLGVPQMTTFLARSSAGGSLTTIFPYTPDSVYFYAGASEGGSVVLFETGGYPGTVFTGKSEVYAWDRSVGELSLASVMNQPSEESALAKGAFAGSYDWASGTDTGSLEEGGALHDYYTQDQRVISAGGSAVYFTASGTGQLYLRRNPTEDQSPLGKDGECLDPTLACTIRVSASQRTVPDPAGARPAAFQGASADGTKAFFTSSEMLTDDAVTGPEQEQAAIARSDLDGKPESIELDFIPVHAKGIAVDGEYIYWANPGENVIGRAKLGASGPEGIEQGFIPTGPGTPQYVAVGGEYVYWTNAADGEGFNIGNDSTPDEGTIGRAKLGAGGPEEIKPNFITGASFPQGIAVDATHIYWANGSGIDGTSNGGTESTIGRASINGEDVDQLFLALSSGAIRPSAVAVNADHFYWAEHNAFIESSTSVHLRDLDNDPASGKRAYPDGSGLADPPFAIRGIALGDEYLYWASESNGTIARVDVDLSIEAPSSAEVEFIKGLEHPLGIAVDGSHIYWSSNGESPPNPGNDLYRYDAETGELTDISAGASGPDGAEVRGVVGISEDGSRAYFVANGDLDGPGPATQGDCSGSAFNGEGVCSLYLWHEGEIRFITRLDADADAENWVATPLIDPSSAFQKSSRLSADGRTLLFSSARRLTAYDSREMVELYRYYAPDESILCVSCNPTGEAPAEGTNSLGKVEPRSPSFGEINATALIPARPAPVLSHVLSDDGKRVFFESPDPLVAADTNYEFTDAQDRPCPEAGGYLNNFLTCLDVYMWEAEGKGSCEKPEGCFYLLSTGTERGASLFAGASVSGDDAFIFTRSKLVGQDTDLQRDVYAVSVGGGLASQYPQQKPSCEAEGCKPAPASPPQSQSAGTAAFVGPPNPKPKRKKARHKRKHRSKRASHRRAHANRRAHR